MDAKKPRIVACPRCGGPVAWEPQSRFRPFCSPRCKVIDLGAWATEQYRVPDDSGPDEDGGSGSTDEAPPI